jgi:hypothetical protein
MPHTDFCLTSESYFVDRPLCPVCDEEMWLVSIVPVAPDTIKRRFQCPVCEPLPAEEVA